MSKNKELSQDYFDRHPSSDACHITSDGRVFHNVGTADGYATALKDNKVETFTRDSKKVADIDVNGASDETKKIAAPKVPVKPAAAKAPAKAAAKKAAVNPVAPKPEAQTTAAPEAANTQE